MSKCKYCKADGINRSHRSEFRGRAVNKAEFKSLTIFID